MNALAKISTVFEKDMTLIALAVALLSLFLPKSTLWIQTAWINPLLMPMPSNQIPPAKRVVWICEPLKAVVVKQNY